MKSHQLPLEILESRIAPAVLLVHPGGMRVTDAATKANAMDTGGETAAASAVNSDLAFLMSKGDTLVYDANQNSKADTGETVLVSITTGKAMVFMTDRDSDGIFDRDEITGLAVRGTATEAFSAVIQTDVSGDIATVLASNDTLSFADGNLSLVSPSGTLPSINNLKITGAVFGDLAATGTVNLLTIGKSLHRSGNNYSILKVVTGTEADNSNGALFFGRDGLPLSAFTPSTGTAGAGITQVTLAAGAAALRAGDGGANAAGGSISKVTIPACFGDLSMAAGDGGSASGGIAGAGGSISTISLSSRFMLGNLSLTGGNGGTGAVSTLSGSGGAVSGITLKLGQMNGSVSLSGGQGGAAGGNNGTAGAGGNVSSVTFTATGETASTLSFLGGTGGSNSGDFNQANAGKGGNVSGITVTTALSKDSILFQGGAGGSGDDDKQGNGGNGGSISGITVTGTVFSKNQIRLLGGAGGTTVAGNAGAGGDVQNVTPP